jgi:tRNA(fMet)-specific endonuclease VapC
MIYMLDTNIVSLLIRGDNDVLSQLKTTSTQDICISVVTEAELLYGLAKRGHPAGLSATVKAFLERVTVYPWNSDTAIQYGNFRASCEQKGANLAAMDMMIAAHAYTFQINGNDLTLVTRDKAFHFAASEMPSFNVALW